MDYKELAFLRPDEPAREPDLVVELRDCAQPGGLMEQAADEIERLREGLREIAAIENANYCDHTAIARRLLGEEK